MESTVADGKPAEKKLDLTKAYEILDSYPRSRRYLIPILQKVQAAYRFLPGEILEILMEELDVTRAQIYGVISFYPGLMITEPGKFILKVCVGTACFVKGASIICSKIDDKYHIKPGQTDVKKLYTLQTASCMGNCGAAPILLVGKSFFGNLDPEKTVETLVSFENVEPE